MITSVVNCLIEIYKDFERMASLKKSEIEKHLKLVKEKETLEKSDVQTVGFFKKKTKT